MSERNPHHVRRSLAYARKKAEHGTWGRGIRWVHTPSSLALPKTRTGPAEQRRPLTATVGEFLEANPRPHGDRVDTLEIVPITVGAGGTVRATVQVPWAFELGGNREGRFLRVPPRVAQAFVICHVKVGNTHVLVAEDGFRCEPVPGVCFLQEAIPVVIRAAVPCGGYIEIEAKNVSAGPCEFSGTVIGRKKEQRP